MADKDTGEDMVAETQSEKTAAPDRSAIDQPDDLPDPDDLPELRIYSHSTLLYWWPVWLVGYVMALITYFKGGAIELDQVRQE